MITRLAQRGAQRTQGAMLDSGYVVKLPSLWRMRLHAAMSQRDLATKAGVSPSTIARIESGEDAHPSTLKKLATALGVKPADLMEQPQ